MQLSEFPGIVLERNLNRRKPCKYLQDLLNVVVGRLSQHGSPRQDVELFVNMT